MGILDNINKIYQQKRKQLELNQVKLAKLLNITQPAVSQYLNGQIPLNTDIIINLARILQVSPSALDPSLQTTFLLGRTKRPVPMINEKESISLFASEGALGFRIPDNSHAPRFAKGDILIFQHLELYQLALELLIIVYHDTEFFIGRIITQNTLYTQKDGTPKEIKLPYKDFQYGLIESLIPNSLTGEN